MTTMPGLYHYRSRTDSDKNWISQRMSVIPEDQKESVCIQYDRLFRKGEPEQRKAANQYLDAEARKYRPKPRPQEATEVKVSQPTGKGIEAARRMLSASSSKQEIPRRKGMLESMLDDVDKSRGRTT